MRFKSLLAALAVVLSVSMAAPDRAQAGWPGAHYSKSHGKIGTDPYAYSYVPRSYYTNSTSRYWRPANKVHRHYKIHKHYKYRYYPAWGYKNSRRTHRRWFR